LVSSSFSICEVFPSLIVPFVKWQWFCQSVLFNFNFLLSTIDQTKWNSVFQRYFKGKGTSCLEAALATISTA
jgi:hypothetical protein